MLNTRKNKLYKLCIKFINDNEILAPECIYQNDHVIEKAYSFIENICDLIGYVDIDDDLNVMKLKE